MDLPPDLRMALRFLTRTGVVDYNGHVSQRVTGGFAINSGDSNRAQPTADAVSLLSLEGTLLDGRRPPNEWPLHAAIYRARPDVGAVVHGHPAAITTLSAARQPLRPVMPQAALLGELPVYPQAHSISCPERAMAVASLMGQAPGAILQGHGLVMTGPDVLTAAVLALYAEQTAERQVRAAPLGGAADLTPEDIEEYRRTLNSPALFRKAWDFYLTED